MPPGENAHVIDIGIGSLSDTVWAIIQEDLSSEIFSDVPLETLLDENPALTSISLYKYDFD